MVSELRDLPPALTVKQAASLIGISTDAIYEAVADGRLPWPVVRIGRAIRIPTQPLLESLGLAPTGYGSEKSCA